LLEATDGIDILSLSPHHTGLGRERLCGQW
jgi:hypothetical protein